VREDPRRATGHAGLILELGEEPVPDLGDRWFAEHLVRSNAVDGHRERVPRNLARIDERRDDEELAAGVDVEPDGAELAHGAAEVRGLDVDADDDHRRAR
jgi:hypothetical protein